MGVREGFLFSKSQKITPEEILESLRKHYNFDKSYSTIWSVCKAKTLKDFDYLNKSFNKDTIGLIIQFDTLEEQVQELINTLPKEIAWDLEFNNISFMLDYEENFEDQKFYDSNLNKNKINKNESEEKKIMKIKVEVKEERSEKDEKLRGFADLTLGDVVIKGVAVKEFESKENEGETYFGFQMPTSRSYEKEKEDGTKEKVFIPAITLKGKEEKDTKELVKNIRDCITQAITSSETNEHGKKVVEGEIDLDYDKDKIIAYARPIESENRPNLKASASVYLGNIVKINDVLLTEGTKENGEKFSGISFPTAKPYEKTLEDGTKEKVYPEKVFTIGEGMRNAIKEKIEESYLEILEKQSKEEEQKQEEEEDLEP